MLWNFSFFLQASQRTQKSWTSSSDSTSFISISLSFNRTQLQKVLNLHIHFFKNYFPVLWLWASPVGPPQRVIMTMASLTADKTTTWCPTNQMSIPKPSTSTPKLTASKYGTRCINLTSFLTQSVLWEIPTRNSHTTASAAAIIYTDDDEQTLPLTHTTCPTTVVDATEPGITLTLLCNNEPYAYRLQLTEQTSELEWMQQSWLMLEALFNCIQSDSDASKHPQSPSNHSTPDAPTPWPQDTTSVPADVCSTTTIIYTLLENSMNIQVEQAKQSKSLHNLLAMSKVLIEGMNLILHQLDTINPCLPPPQYDFVQLHHPTPTMGKLGKSAITQTVVPATQIQMMVVSNPVNPLPQTNEPPWPCLNLSNPRNHPSQKNHVLTRKLSRPNSLSPANILFHHKPRIVFAHPNVVSFILAITIPLNQCGSSSN